MEQAGFALLHYFSWHDCAQNQIVFSIDIVDQSISGDIVGIERTQQGTRGRSESSARGFNVVRQPCLIEAVQGQGKVGDAGEARDLRGVQTASRDERAANRAPALAIDNGLRINQHWAGGKQRYSQHLAPRMSVMHQKRAGSKMRPETLGNFRRSSRHRVIGLSKHLPAMGIEDQNEVDPQTRKPRIWEFADRKVGLSALKVCASIVPSGVITGGVVERGEVVV